MSKGIKVLITGASGFLGKNLSGHLSGKDNLLLPSHQDLDLLEESAVKDYLSAHRPDVVVHCAAVGVNRKDNSPEALFANLRMFVNLARCHQLYGRMIFLGSGAEYDKRRELIKVKEEDFGACLPADPYGFGKYLCSLLIEHIPNIVNLRAFAVFGKYEDYETRFISNTICRNLFDLPVVINQDVRFDYFSVNDLAKAVDYFISHEPHHQFYNIGAGRQITLTEIVKKIEQLSGKKLQVTIKIPGFNKEYSCDNSRLLAEISNFKFTPFDTALADLYDWYTVHQKQIDKDKLLFDK